MSSGLIDSINQIEATLVYSFQKTVSHPYLDAFFSFITDLHKQLFFQLFIVVPLLGFWLWKEKKSGLIKLFGLIINLVLIDGICGQFIKKVFARARPFEIASVIVQRSPASGYSFVSNHAANMVGLAVYMSYFYPRWKWWWWSLALLVGVSRVYNGVHFLGDVIFGGLIGWMLSRRVVSWIAHKYQMEKS